MMANKANERIFSETMEAVAERIDGCLDELCEEIENEIEGIGEEDLWDDYPGEAEAVMNGLAGLIDDTGALKKKVAMLVRPGELDREWDEAYLFRLVQRIEDDLDREFKRGLAG